MPEIVAFTADHVCRLTDLSARQLRYWDRTGFFSPTLLDEHRSRAFGRIYSFRDVVGLRVIAVLRNGVPLQELRRVGEWLKARHADPWSTQQFYLQGRKVVLHDPASGAPTEASGVGQRVLAIALEPIAGQMQRAAERLRARGKDQVGKIVRNRYVVHNAYVVAGTRIPTSAIWNLHAAEYSAKDIIREYPRLKLKDITAAISFEGRRRRAA